MKTYFKLFLLFILAHNVVAQKNFISKEFDASKIENLVVNTSGGSIKVEGGTKAIVNVVVNGSNELSNDEINKLLLNYNLDIFQNGSTISCIAKPKDKISWKNSLSISFNIIMPEHVNVNLNTNGGGITLNNLDGKLNFKTSGGSLNLNKINGEIDGQTSGGAIVLSNSSGNIILITSGGAIKASDFKGNVTLKTSGGSINLSNMSGNIMAKTSGGSIHSMNGDGSLEVSTSGGSIDLKNMNGDIIANTSAGNIDLDIHGLNKIVELKTAAGNIHANLPFEKGMNLYIKGSKIKSEKLAKVSKSIETGLVEGKVNGGGTKVYLNSSLGIVSVE